VCNHTSPTSENNPRGPADSWLARLIQATGGRLFAKHDKEAAEHGWQIICRQRGLGRSYRDPGFDMLIPCPRCDGDGAAGAAPCRPCGGTGRTTRAALCQGEPS
jgi:hypothetical protein